MKDTIDISLKYWERATQDLMAHFVEKYFGVDADTYWIAGEVGKVLYVNEYFFSMTDIVDFIKYKYTPKQMFAYYDYKMTLPVQGRCQICIRDWKKIKK